MIWCNQKISPINNEDFEIHSARVAVKPILKRLGIVNHEARIN
jgi:hypothetical protein